MFDTGTGRHCLWAAGRPALAPAPSGPCPACWRVRSRL